MQQSLQKIPRPFQFLMLVVAAMLLTTVLYFLLRSPTKPVATTQGIPLSGGSSSPQGGISEMGAGLSRVSIRLSEGQAQPVEAAAREQVVTGEPLPPDEIERILSRLPELSPEQDDQVDFRLAQDPIPPPRTGETIQETFPPSQEAPTPEPQTSGPLEVLRFAPEGEIPLAPFVSLTFNQPMVPLGTLGDLADEQVPVVIEPALPGTWRWIGAKTLTWEFDSELIDRLPKATVYRVTVPAGTQSATGGVLAESVEWTFSTPPPKMISAYPQDEPQPVDPLIFIAFDQRIDPAAVLETMQVSAAGQPVGMQIATPDEIQADPEMQRRVEDAQDGRWMVIRPSQSLPHDAPVSVVIGPGTPSAEGPLLTQEAQSFGFYTYAPLRIEEHGCSWSNEVCRPLTPFYIRFNNPLEAESYQDVMLSIEPELPGASVNIYGNTLNIQGASQGQTTYTVEVSGQIRDIFGQSLGEDARLTFQVGPAEPLLFGPEQILVTLDPWVRKPIFSVYAINYDRLDVKIYAVQPDDWPAFQKYLQDYQRTDSPPSPPGRLMLNEAMPVETQPDSLVEVGIDLSQYMDGDFGHFIVIVTPPRALFKPQDYWQTVNAWVQVTQIGLDAFTDHSEMVAWTTALKDGAPLPGVTIAAGASGEQAITAEDGTARFPIPEGATYLVGRLGTDQVLLPRFASYWVEEGWRSQTIRDDLRWYVFDDRQMYRPGEDLHLKGWLRRVGGGQYGDVGLVAGSVDSVNYRVTDPQGNELLNGRSEVNTLGGFDLSFTLPEETNLGYAQIEFTAEGDLSGFSGSQFYHSFQIQEFRRPEFEVSARNETPGPYFAGSPATVAVQASYYAGGPLPNAEVNWQVSSTPSSYAPPNWPDFIFGKWQPWWWFGPFSAEMPGGPWPGSGETIYEGFSGFTDATGTHYLRLDFDQFPEPQPYSILAEATVIDVNRQAWTGSTTLLVHPADLYVGLRSQRMFVERGTPLEIDMIVTDLDGNLIPGNLVEVRAARLEWKYRGGEWGEEEVDPQVCSLVSEAEPLSCSFETPLGGEYRITAVVADGQGRQNQTQLTRWVSGGQRPPSRKVELETLTLIPDKEIYQPGDVAQILVQPPFTPAEGLLTVSRSGILYTQPFHLEGNSITLEVPVEQAHIPNLNVQVDLVGSAPRVDDRGEPLTDAPPRPAYASGSLNLDIPPLERTLSLQVAPAEPELEPGGETLINLQLIDSQGRPVPSAEVAVVVVDEAVLALSSYQLSDPLEIFYAVRQSDTNASYGRASLVLVDPLSLIGEAAVGNVLQKVETELAVMESAPMEAPAAAMPTMTAQAMDAGSRQSSADPAIRMRSDFNPLALFAPIVRTGADGVAQTVVKLPDNLTRYRVMAVAVDESGRQFGMGEANLVARLALMVRPSAPRFLNFGDRFELPVVLQNQTDQDMQVDVVLRASNLELTDSPGLRVSVPARDRVEVRFPAAAMLAGTARFQVAAVSGAYSDAAVGELPVYTPATSEAFATYGVVDGDAALQPVSAPSDVFPQYGGLEISTSSTALQALTDAVLYLVKYPFECSEQLASRILAVAALRDVLSAFSAEGMPSPEEMQASVSQDIQLLQGLQNPDGGFPYWRRGQDSIPFNSIHVAHALQRAEQMGFQVPQEMKLGLQDHLRQIENYYPEWYSQRTRWTLSAYALYVRSLTGDRDTDKALRLLDEAGLENLDLDAIGWLWPVLLDEPNAETQLDAIRRYVGNRVVETAGAANFTTQYDDQTYLLLSSDRRTDAILLDALMADDPQHDLIPKLVNGLLAHRTRGRWENTQENVFVLLALDRYFKTFEAQTPDFVARIWLGEAYAGDHEFRGRTTERSETLIPMTYLVDENLGGGEDQLLTIGKDGAGRLYYRIGLRYAPTDLQLDALDMGFVVQRSYEGLDNPQDVYQDAEGVWHIKAGERVRVRLSMVADNRRYHVALVDPLPAGLEIVNPALAVSGGIPPDQQNPDLHSGWWWGPWYEHQNLRDERAEAFTPLLWDGVYEYSYITRATTPGRFVVPPTRAEEMYSPEVFGRSASDVVVVE